MPDAFLARCLYLDLETRRQDRIYQIGAVFGREVFERKGDFHPGRALAELDRRARPADFVLGHNLLGHDLPVLRKLAPNLALHAKGVVDTLYLSPLAFPENPYHHLVKDYKLVKSSINDPVADARLAARVFRDQWTSFAALNSADPDRLRLYAFCLVHDSDHGGLADVFGAITGRPPMTGEEAAAYLAKTFAGVVCRSSLAKLTRELDHAAQRPAWAYVAAWLDVAGGNSVLPPWVRRRYPDTVELLRALRDAACDATECLYCTRTHDPTSQLRRYFGFEGLPAPACHR